MNYQETIAYLDSLQSTNIKLGLERISAACEALGRPSLKFPSILVAGTNGKGSTCAFLESILRHHGLKVGLYTSPHLIDIRERIQINREMISERDFANLVNIVKNTNVLTHQRTNAPTYFEFLTAMAFQYFAEAKIDVAVLEIGLGGRFDATNVVTPLVSIITRIGMDHQKYLGDTIEKVAYEKCGIIKKGVPVVTIDQSPAAMDVIRRVADEKDAMLHVVSPHEIKWKLGLAGRHQLENAALAVRAAEIVTPSLTLPPRGGGRGWGGNVIKSALANTRWPGRLEIVSKNPLVILDGAHNPNGAEALARFLKENYNDKYKILLTGIMADKDIEGIVKPLAAVADEFIITKPSTERAAEPSLLFNILQRQHASTPARRHDSLSIAIQKTLSSMSKDSILIITGSLYTVGEARRLFT